jgi:hypothetical protein
MAQKKKPKEREVSILEQAATAGEGLSDSFKTMFNMAFGLIGLGMIQGLGRTIAPAMENVQEGFTQSAPVSLARNNTPKMSAFTPSGPK